MNFIISMISVILLTLFLRKRDRVVYREKIDGPSKNGGWSDRYNIDNTGTKYVTHYKSGRKKFNYISGDEYNITITWLGPDNTEQQTIICGFWQELYYLIVVAIWNWLDLFEERKNEKEEKQSPCKTGKIIPDLQEY